MGTAGIDWLQSPRSDRGAHAGGGGGGGAALDGTAPAAGGARGRGRERRRLLPARRRDRGVSGRHGLLLSEHLPADDRRPDTHDEGQERDEDDVNRRHESDAQERQAGEDAERDFERVELHRVIRRPPAGLAVARPLRPSVRLVCDVLHLRNCPLRERRSACRGPLLTSSPQRSDGTATRRSFALVPASSITSTTSASRGASAPVSRSAPRTMACAVAETA